MWIIFHKATCPRLYIDEQNAADVAEAARERMAAAEAAEAARVARAAQRARMAASGAERLACLRAAMVAAHPDKPGGSAAAFIKARAAYVGARR
jgi:hypothetical protein